MTPRQAEPQLPHLQKGNDNQAEGGMTWYTVHIKFPYKIEYYTKGKVLFSIVVKYI